MTGCSLRWASWRRGRAGTVLGIAPWCVLVLLLALVAGCGGPRVNVPRSEFVPFTPEQKAVLATRAAHEYRIQEGDVLKVYFPYERALNQEFVHVLSDGSVNLVGIDRVVLAGLTMAQADSILTASYSRDYREPELSVIMQESRGRRVYVLGEVSDPGVYVVPSGGIDIMSAITMASGFTENAAREGTLIVRVTLEGYQYQEVNLKDFGAGPFAGSAVMQLQPFDVVYVPRRRIADFGYFTRNVLNGISSMTRITADIYSIAKGQPGRY